MNPAILSLIIIGGIVVYIMLGTTWGLYLYRNHDFYDDYGATVCGIFWPATFIIIVPIGMVMMFVNYMGRKTRSNEGWRRR